MMSRLSMKTVVITGASSGIGAACARHFARKGARLLLCARRNDLLEAMADDLQSTGAPAVFTCRLDVRDRDAVHETFGSLPADWEQLDILVNNAGLSRGLDPIHKGMIDDWDEMIDTNVKGLLYVTHALLAGMVARGSGHIINIGSIAGHEVYPKGNVYCATKHAVAAITQGLQIDLHGTGVRVTTIDPGLVQTEFSLVRFRGDADRATSVYKNTRPLRPDDVAEAVVWAADRPEHVSVHEIVLMSADQASATLVLRRDEVASRPASDRRADGYDDGGGQPP